MLHSFHLAQAGVWRVARTLCAPPTPARVGGLQQAECMFPMQLGAPVYAPGRWQLGTLAMFAAWEHEAALDQFLTTTALGRTFAKGWHVRLRFVRRWGSVQGFDHLPPVAEPTNLEAPVVAVTLARLRLSQALRFVRWGLPVERHVRDAPGTTLARAATRPLRTMATFSVWQTARHMMEMLHGHTSAAQPNPHQAGMRERTRKDFHHEFTTLRFACVGEFGSWRGRTNIVPKQ